MDWNNLTREELEREYRVVENNHYNATVKGMLRVFNKTTDDYLAQQCNVCLELKSIDQFFRHKGSFRKKSRKCIECSGQEIQEYRTTNSEKIRTYAKEYRAGRPERNSEQSARYSSRTEHQITEARARLRPEGVKQCRKCKAKLSLAEFYRDPGRPDGLTDGCIPCTILGVKARQRRVHEEYWTAKGIPHTCYVCGESYEDADHVNPLSLDGPDAVTNLLPTCGHHNNSKYNTPLLKWLTRNHPSISEEVMQRVLDYGVDPWTREDIVWRLSDETL